MNKTFDKPAELIPPVAPIPPPIEDKLMRLAEVEERVRIKRTAIYRNMKYGQPLFPQPIKMQGATFWIESEIDGYIAALKARRVLLPAC